MIISFMIATKADCFGLVLETSPVTPMFNYIHGTGPSSIGHNIQLQQLSTVALLLKMPDCRVEIRVI